MENLEITSISSRGQVVIPQKLREKLKIKEGEKFVVIGEGSTILLKKVEMPSFEGLDKLLKKTREFARNIKLEEKDIDLAIENTRKNESRSRH